MTISATSKPVHFRFFHARFAVALFAGALLAAPALAQTPALRSGAAVHDTSAIHIDNFGRVSDTYFRGGQPDGHDYADLASAGVKTIINLTSDDAQANERAMTETAGMKYIQIPMSTHTAPTAAQIAQFLSIVNNPANEPVYVHCVGGRHRTGVMTAIYRMNDDGWSSSHAFAEMKHYKFGMDFLHPEFKAFVMDYHPAPNAHAAAAATAPAADPHADTHKVGG
ncbi:MAG: fused DSP-PTPase phosphatase/NAD kinase-like protein [Vicinamibacterales bacterium]